MIDAGRRRGNGQPSRASPGAAAPRPAKKKESELNCNRSVFQDATMALQLSRVVPSGRALVVIDDDTTCLDFPLPRKYLCHPCWYHLEALGSAKKKAKHEQLPCCQPWMRKPAKKIISYKEPLEWLNDERLFAAEWMARSRAMRALEAEEKAAEEAAGAGLVPAGSVSNKSEASPCLDEHWERFDGPTFRRKRPLGEDEVVVSIAANDNDFRLKKVATICEFCSSIIEDSSIAAIVTDISAGNGEDDADAAVDAMRGAAIDVSIGADSFLNSISPCASADDDAVEDAVNDDASDNDAPHDDAAGAAVTQAPAVEDALVTQAPVVESSKTTHDPMVADAVATQPPVVADPLMTQAPVDASAKTNRQEPVVADVVEAILSTLQRADDEKTRVTTGVTCTADINSFSSATSALTRPQAPPTPFIETTAMPPVAAVTTAPEDDPPRSLKNPKPVLAPASLPLKKRKAWYAPKRATQGPAPRPEPPAVAPASTGVANDPNVVTARPERGPNSRPIQQTVNPRCSTSLERPANPSKRVTWGHLDSRTHVSSTASVAEKNDSHETDAVARGTANHDERSRSPPDVEPQWPFEVSIYDAEPCRGMEIMARLKTSAQRRLAMAARSEDGDDGASMDSSVSTLEDTIVERPTVDLRHVTWSREGSDCCTPLNHPGKAFWDEQYVKRDANLATTTHSGVGGDDDESLLTEVATTETSVPVKPALPCSPRAVKRPASVLARERNKEICDHTAASYEVPESIPVADCHDRSGYELMSPLKRSGRDKPTFYEVPAPDPEKRKLAIPTNDGSTESSTLGESGTGTWKDFLMDWLKWGAPSRED